ncbi:MAG: EAL domain-containing protein [Solirubrobacteraceae bacterium]|nr:EAL domain-containing protein [Solirubrobacteraceae bacterium]
MAPLPWFLRALLGLATALLGVQALDAAGAVALGDGAARVIAAAVPLAAAASIAARAIRLRDCRLAWGLLAFGVGVWAVGYAVWTLHYDYGREDESLGPFYVLYPYAAAFLVFELRARHPRVRPAAWLDLTAAMLAVAAVGFGIILPLVPDTGAAIFPILGVALVALVIGLFAVASWSPGREWLIWGLGFATIAVADLVWAIADRTPVAVSVVLWSAGPLLLGWGAWLTPTRMPELESEVPERLVWPFALFLASLGIIVAGNITPLPPVAIVLAVASMIVATYRTGRAYREVRALPETRRLAHTDELTGLVNRRGFLDAVASELQEHPGRSTAVLMLDLDRFKELNDTLGHAAGDRLLAELGPRLSAALRPGDTLARLGGDEFAILCPGAGAAGARRVARRLHEAVEEPFAIGDLSVHVDVSAGFAVAPADGRTVSELLQRADVAMYQAKGGGTAVERYDATRDWNSRDRLQLAGELRAALDAGGQLKLHYQPQTSLADGRVVGVEALVRWRHPRRGLLVPAAFLEVAEGSGLMRRIGREVLRMAVAQAARLRDGGYDVPVAVNLSTADLVDRALPTEVAQLLDAARLDGRRLTLEITENTVMAQPERVLRMIHDLRALGCRVSLDDFGTGHASLEHLASLPVDELKIDRAFVSGMDRGEPAGTAIVRALSLLGRDLGVEVVAEGVETSSAWAELAACGATTAQGNLVAPPLSGSELDAWLAERREVGDDVEEHVA